MAANRVEAVERALEILNSFTENKTILSLKQLAENTGFYKSTILRLAASLERFDYLIRQEDGNYRLGSATLRLGEIYRKSASVSDIVRPVIEKLRNQFNESVAFYIKNGNLRICLYRANANRAIRHQIEEGNQLPLGCGAAGRILLAYTGTKGEPYETIVHQGWYASLGERDPEVAAVGVPILSSGGQIQAALCISGLISRFDETRQQEFVTALQKEADKLSQKLSHFNLS